MLELMVSLSKDQLLDQVLHETAGFLVLKKTIKEATGDYLKE